MAPLLYSYNPYNGLVAAVTNDTTGGHVAYEFEDMDRLESITWKNDQGGTVRSFDYAYSAAGMVTNITLESGAQLAYTYDSLQRLTSEKRLSLTGAKPNTGRAKPNTGRTYSIVDSHGFSK